MVTRRQYNNRILNENPKWAHTENYVIQFMKNASNKILIE